MSFTELWEVAQKGTPVAIVILAIGGVFIWNAYQKELSYGKTFSREMLTLLLSLSHLVEGLDKNKNEQRDFHTSAKNEVLVAIKELEKLLREHVSKNK